MLFSFAVRSVYMESCSMFVRGGVYIVVRDSIGPTVAKLSVSSLVVDYILTGPISVVAAGQYLGRLLNEVSETAHQTWRTNPNWFSVFFSVAVTVYFWWSNIKGVPESSGKALRIMQITTVMVVILLIWCPLTLALRGGTQLPPAPTPSNLHITKESWGWLDGTFWTQLPFVIMIVALGHSLLAMSGFETLAQVYRELAYPKLKNLRLTANIICTYAVVSTGLISILAVMIIPDATAMAVMLAYNMVTAAAPTATTNATLVNAANGTASEMKSIYCPRGARSAGMGNLHRTESVVESKGE